MRTSKYLLIQLSRSITCFLTQHTFPLINCENCCYYFEYKILLDEKINSAPSPMQQLMKSRCDIHKAISMEKMRNFTPKKKT